MYALISAQDTSVDMQITRKFGRTLQNATETASFLVELLFNAVGFACELFFMNMNILHFQKSILVAKKRRFTWIFFQNLQKQACQSDKCKLFTCREISQILLFYLAIRELIAKSTASSFTVVVICKIHHPMWSPNEYEATLQRQWRCYVYAALLYNVNCECECECRTERFFFAVTDGDLFNCLTLL